MDIQYMLEVFPTILSGVKITALISVVSTIISFVIGIIIAYIIFLEVPILKQITNLYLFIIRGTPVIAQLYFFYFGLAVYSDFIRDMNPIVATSIVIGLGVGAFMAESIRSGLLSVDKGQIEAAESLGMSQFMIVLRIVSPQAFRVALPNLFNNVISLVKLTSLAFMLGVPDIMGMGSILGAKSFRYFDIYATVMIVYLMIIGVMNIIYNRLNKKADKVY